MITDEKIKEFQKLLKKGLPAGEIREILLREGHSKEDIEKVFAPRPYNMKAWYLISAIILLVPGVRLFLDNKNILLLIFSAAMFIQYFREDTRLKSQQLAGSATQDKDPDDSATNPDTGQG